MTTKEDDVQFSVMALDDVRILTAQLSTILRNRAVSIAYRRPDRPVIVTPADVNEAGRHIIGALADNL